jgi:thymidine kinase
MDLFSESEVITYRGRVIGWFSTVNSAKSQKMGKAVEDSRQSNLNFAIYQHERNDRDEGLCVNGNNKLFNAITIGDINEAKEDLTDRIRMLRSNARAIKKRVDEKGNIEYKGMVHKKAWPLVVYAIDEANLFLLSKKEEEDFIEFMEWGREKGFIGLLAGLKYDFRQMPFGHIGDVLQYVEHQPVTRARCKAAHTGTPCGKPAMHTQRLWKSDFADEVGLGELVEHMEMFDFATKDGDVVSEKFYAAPFFDKTVRIEKKDANGNKKIEYIPVCNNCSRLPFKEETFKVYKEIISGKDNTKMVDPELLKNITSFLVEEKWVKSDGGILVPIPSYHTEFGGYSHEP